MNEFNEFASTPFDVDIEDDIEQMRNENHSNFQSEYSTQNQTENMNPSTEVSVAQSKKESIPSNFTIGMPNNSEAINDVGIATVEIGTKISSVPIEKYKASEDRVDRIAFISKQVTAVKTHYIENFGNVVCFGGKCCDDMGSPKIRYLLPIAKYQTDNDGKVVGSKVELMILSAGEDLYKNIVTLQRSTESMGGIDYIDVLVTCSDSKYQKISLTYAGEAMWRKSNSVANFLNEHWMRDGDKAYMAIARKIDEKKYEELFGDDVTDNDLNYNSGLNNMSDADLSKFFGD